MRLGGVGSGLAKGAAGAGPPTSAYRDWLPGLAGPAAGGPSVARAIGGGVGALASGRRAGAAGPAVVADSAAGRPAGAASVAGAWGVGRYPSPERPTCGPGGVGSAVEPRVTGRSWFSAGDGDTFATGVGLVFGLATGSSGASSEAVRTADWPGAGTCGRHSVLTSIRWAPATRPATSQAWRLPMGV